MPWFLLGRLLGVFVLLRFLRRARRGGVGIPNIPLRRVRIRDVTDDAALATYVITGAVAGLGALGFAVVATTFYVLGPLWLAIASSVLLLTCASTSLAAVLRSRKALEMRRWRTRPVVIPTEDTPQAK